MEGAKLEKSRANKGRFRPLIGVFINKKLLWTRRVVLFARKLYQANDKAKCSIYFFSHENIDWEKQKIRGYLYGGSKKRWQESLLPFPDIVYDRGAGFGRLEEGNVERLRARFKKIPGIQFINSCKLPKWQLHQKLSRHKAVNKYLPATNLSRGIQDIRKAIAKHGYLFLKSSGGSGGKDVFALEKQKGGFYFHYYLKGIHRKRYASNLRSLQSELNAIGLRPDRVIIQQGIRLVKYNNRLMDLRVLMVKDREGIWSAVYNQARLAQSGAVITNLSLGGEVMNYSDIYPALKKKYPGIPSDNQVRRICVVISRYIEKEFGSFGEIGMDIGVDYSGRFWLLEANSKPTKLPEQGLEDTEGISPQFLMTLDYARLLYSKRRGI